MTLSGYGLQQGAEKSSSDAVIIGGIRTTRLARTQLCDLVLDATDSSATPRLLFDINGQGLAMSLWDRPYREALADADVVHADGQPLVIASRLLTATPVAERSATTDLFHDVARGAVNTADSFYLLGASEEVNARCAATLERTYPGLRIAGRHHGYFGPASEDGLCRSINETGATIVWVGLGKPLEQEFCVRNRHLLRARWLITCGGCFNFVTGGYQRAPKWMQQAGFEWLHRMVSRPRQLAFRYLTTSPVAAYLLLTRTKEIA